MVQSRGKQIQSHPSPASPDLVWEWDSALTGQDHWESTETKVRTGRTRDRYDTEGRGWRTTLCTPLWAAHQTSVWAGRLSGAEALPPVPVQCPSMLVVDTDRGALHIVTHCRLRCTKRLVWTRCLDVDASKAAGFLKTGRESVAERWSLINEQLPLGRELE